MKQFDSAADKVAFSYTQQIKNISAIISFS
jgi:hypothetical protein